MGVVNQAAKKLEGWRRENAVRTDRLMATLMLAQWAFAIGLALVVSPQTWKGSANAIHLHVWVAFLVGGAINALPLFMVANYPGEVSTRHVVAVAQMLWSALLIHLTGGRIETHFHVFGSLAFIAFYKDWKPLVTATVVVAGDHLLRGLYWPESVYGLFSPDHFRFLEHAGWVVFEDVVLVFSCLRGEAEWAALAEGQVQVEELSTQRQLAAEGLSKAMDELQASQAARIRGEKLAALGSLAAGVGHDLRNPLGAIRGAASFVARRVASGQADEPRVAQFLALIDREVKACDRIITDLLDFARERPPASEACPIGPLVAEALQIVNPGKVQVVSRIPETLPIPDLDREQMRRVVMNLVQNAVDAIPADRTDGEVVVESQAEVDGSAVLIRVQDNGSGIPPEVRERIFEPLFTTKLKGTGLGLPIVAGIVAAHKGRITVASTVGKGTTFEVRIPLRAGCAAPAAAAAPAGVAGEARILQFPVSTATEGAGAPYRLLANVGGVA